MRFEFGFEFFPVGTGGGSGKMMTAPAGLEVIVAVASWMLGGEFWDQKDERGNLY